MIEESLNTIKENQMLSTALGVYSAGAITFMLRNVPLKIYSFILKHTTTSITITSYHSIFHHAMKWFELEFKNKNFRTIKLSNGRWGESPSIKSIGYGRHFLLYKKNFILVELIKDEGNKTKADKDIIKITKLGRSHNIFDSLILEFKNIKEDKDKIKMYDFKGHGWEYCKSQFNRDMDSIFLEEEVKDNIKKRLKNFIEKEEWYIENGIPYQLGILLYGAPGTGKTSLIKGIATHLNYPIYYMENLSKIDNAISTLPDKCLLVIEDIDSDSATHHRNKDSKKDRIESISDSFKLTSLSSILNSLDGMFSPHGRILITTTNHIEKLDPALIRPGRIDLKINVGYATKEIFKKFISNYFVVDDIDFQTISIKEEVTVAQLQNYLLEGCNKYEIIENVIK